MGFKSYKALCVFTLPNKILKSSSLKWLNQNAVKPLASSRKEQWWLLPEFPCYPGKWLTPFIGLNTQIPSFLHGTNYCLKWLSEMLSPVIDGNKMLVKLWYEVFVLPKAMTLVHHYSKLSYLPSYQPSPKPILRAYMYQGSLLWCMCRIHHHCIPYLPMPSLLLCVKEKFLPTQPLRCI